MNLEIEHELGCKCWRCLAHCLGCWIDELAAQTSPKRWQVFATITYRTPVYLWQRGFPRDGTGRPKPDFAHHLFHKLITRLERELSTRVDYVVADQLGSINGRFHQHAILAADSLSNYPRREIWAWLKERAGWSRILPFEQGAAYYVSRYIAKDVSQCEWDFCVGNHDSSARQPRAPIGGTDIVSSAMLPKSFFHNTYTRRKR